ncbi:MAG: hypothetical protein U5P41_08265 [Gammaproteobacteria bacterium]|nr:hypothetical protein [Gammaproteobacteria bacterium]
MQSGNTESAGDDAEDAGGGPHSAGPGGGPHLEEERLKEEPRPEFRRSLPRTPDNREAIDDDSGGPAGPRPGFGDALPKDAGRPDTGGPAAGGFVAEPPSIDKAELAIITGPIWRWDDGTRSAGSVLYYGHRYEVSFVVENLGDQPARYRPKYEIGNELNSFPERTIEPGDTQRITWDVPFGWGPIGIENRQRIMVDERIDTRVFLAEAESGAGVYADSNVSNNVSRRSWDVRRRLRLTVQLQRLNQYARCDRWVRDRDWRLWTYLLGTEEGRAHVNSLDGNPAFLDASVKATMSLGPLSYRSLVTPDADEVGFSTRVYGLKDDGSIKNRGRSAMFSMRQSLRSLMDRNVNRELRSTESGGSFCGEGNLGLDVLMRLTIAPYE